VGVLQIVGAASGGTDPLRPLARFSARSELAGAGEVHFTAVRNVAELDAALAAAGKPVMLDFYADWCVSCKEMERFTFSDRGVRQRLSNAVLLKADVTRNGPDDRARKGGLPERCRPTFRSSHRRSARHRSRAMCSST